MKKIYFLVCICLLSGSVQGGIIGSDIVCAGYIYTYKVNMPGAVSFNWTLPAGWYFLSGQGTDSITVDCNVNIGSVCVTGYDTASMPVDTLCQTVNWGGGSGWYVVGGPICPCSECPYILYLEPDGTCGTQGCGSGFQNPNVFFAAFDNPWPSGNYINAVNGSNAFGGGYYGLTIYVYEIDTTFGLNNIILVLDGSGCIINNTFFIPGAFPPPSVNLLQNPSPVCVGDTFTVKLDPTQRTYMAIFDWSASMDSLNLIISYGDSASFVLTGYNSDPIVFFGGYDSSSCQWVGELAVNYIACYPSAPQAQFMASDTELCLESNSCINFTDQSLNNPTRWEWLFPGGMPATSSEQNPQNICYDSAGVYAVMLIAENSIGSDTVIYNNYINVNPAPPPPVITQSQDTLFCSTNPFYVSYQWYIDSSIISGATDTFLVISNGFNNYNVKVTNSNGCIIAAGVNTVTGINKSFTNNSIFLSPNPATNQLSIHTSSTTNWQTAMVSVVNTLGQVALSSSLSFGEGRGEALDVSKLSAGIYFVQLTTEKERWVGKFVKE